MRDSPVHPVATAFVAWQCRIRQHAVRHTDGRPSLGMCPQLMAGAGQDLGRFTSVLVKHNASADAAHFRQIYHSSRSPKERYEAVMTAVQSAYFQHPDEFSDRLTATFAWPSDRVRAILETRHGTVHFEQFGQRFSFPATFRQVQQSTPEWSATYWHNALFNSALPAQVCVLELLPDWTTAICEPAIPDLTPHARM